MCIKSSDTALTDLCNAFDHLGGYHALGFDSSFELQIYRSFLSLMDLAGKIAMTLRGIVRPTDLSAYVEISNLDREMNAWYSTLPDMLEWTSSNVQVVPLSFFLLQ